MISSWHRELVCAGVFSLGLTALVGIRPANSENVSARAGSMLLLAKAEYSSPAFFFKRTRKGGDWLLQYRYKGSSDAWHDLECTINDSASRRVDERYGVGGDLLAARFEAAIAEEGKKVFYYGKPRVLPVYNREKETWSLVPSWVEISDRVTIAEDRDKAIDEQRQFVDWYGRESGRIMNKVRDELLGKRGFLYTRTTGWAPAYSNLIVQSTAALQSCINVINQETEGSPELLMNFFQSMKYVKVPAMEDGTGRMTGGFLLPATVMLKGEGDCDSKAAAFCAIQRTYPPRLVIFRSFQGADAGGPRHALMGVETWATRPPHGQRQRETKESSHLPPWQTTSLDAIFYKDQVLIGLRYYTPCEVAGPGRLLFGQVSPGKEGSYVVIPIAPK